MSRSKVLKYFQLERYLSPIVDIGLCEIQIISGNINVKIESAQIFPIREIFEHFRRHWFMGDETIMIL